MGLGFSSFAFRAAAGRRGTLGAYLALFYATGAATIPLGLLAAFVFYKLLFEGSIALPAFLAVIFVEIALWRLIEVVHQVNNGLGRYSAASSVIVLATAVRTAAAVVFAAVGGGDVESWSATYLAANGAAAVAVWVLYRPRVRLRWRLTLLVGRLRDALLFAVSYFAFNAQSEIDKIVMLSLADERTAGIYAIAARLIDFTTVPMRTFYVLYTRKLIREGRAIDVIRRGLTVEAVIAVTSTAGFLALLAVLHLHPLLLGPNVAVAAQLLAVLLAVPALKNLLEFQSELFFAYGRMTARAVVATALVALKAAALAVLLKTFPAVPDWGAWLNAVYLGLYAISAVVIYRTVSTGARS